MRWSGVAGYSAVTPMIVTADTEQLTTCFFSFAKTGWLESKLVQPILDHNRAANFLYM